MTTELENYYSDLLILQYRDKPKARRDIALKVRNILCDGLFFDLQDLLDVDTAQGKQLDLIGKIVGAPRTVQGLVVVNNFFTFHKSSGESRGFSQVGNPLPYPFKDIANSTLSVYSMLDGDYRNLIKFKIIYNNLSARWKHIDDALYSFFGNDVKVTNNKDMSITFTVNSLMTVPTQAAILLGYLPAPLGVSYTVDYV